MGLGRLAIDKKISCLIFFGSLLLVSITIQDIGITWDEPYYFQSSRLQLEWGKKALTGLFQGNLASAFSKDGIDRYWCRNPYHNPHPPFYKMASSLTWLLFHKLADRFTAYRLSSAFFFSLLLVMLYKMVSKRYGHRVGLFASVSLLLMPRVFGHAHIAATDMPITAMWFFSCYTFWEGLRGRRWSVIFGIVYGLSLATKFTAFLIPLPILVWTILYRKKSSWRNILCGLLISPVVMVIVNPVLWHETFPRISGFICQSISRSQWATFATYYLGRRYIFGLPWHHPLVMIAVTVPAVILAFSLLGAVKLSRDRLRDELGGFFIINIIVFLLIMMLPSSPGHDGVRLFLPLFPFLAGVAAVGFNSLNGTLTNLLKKGKWSAKVGNFPMKVSIALLLAVFLPLSLELYRIHPHELAYYNELVGGLPGAKKVGMETSYWLDAANSRFLTYLNQELPPNSRVCFEPNIYHFMFLQDKGKLRKDIIFTDRAPFDYYLLLVRQGIFSELDWYLYTKCVPMYSVSVRGVPLISIYSFEK